ncbi:sodium:proton antiporter [Paucilactobacillus hokkaidonensis JCM 18461]|uniref:Sodium:proton antiporter n=2 Tax=Paucilactobacillus hokkaidonensis TaxID=1193095 RepID=A0A0A1GYT4_9LACO|nr:Na+/H+ antiporter [Paucilactobacillus hokkaidonensis]KRO08237.1 NhaP-type Na+ H+ and K+ H+ antiporter [Paucilactobacillus hokkaidonensis]BAP86158.1 sodium:proton antiporter [Paucilactobacillus hokkaidonensis JCM 18461]
MPILEAVIFLVVLVLVSNIFGHYIKKVPVSLIQIGLGLLVALLFDVEIPLETNWFLLLFIAPLLFNDGRNFPRRELWKLRGPIFANAILLVFVTTILGGYLIYLFVPRIPLLVAFALAAILSPTDPVAVQSIAKRAKLDDSILHLVSGESLINDASGLIGFKYAVAAVTTGYFSATQAVGDFTYTAVVGLISGLVVVVLIQLLRDLLHNQGINDVVFNVVFKIMTPFIVYLCAEELFHASGVIAVVAAGVFSNTRESNVVEELPELRLVTERTWDLVVYLLNGIVFVILGIELPIAMRAALRSGDINNLTAIFYVVVVWLVILLLRVGWIYTFELYQRFIGKKKRKVSLKSAFLAGLSGVRGAITMAGVLSVPITIKSGAPFPERSLMLFIAAGVIILSMVVAAIMLPLISKTDFSFLTRGSEPDQVDELMEDDDDEPDKYQHLSESDAKYFLMQLAIQTVEENRREDNQRAAYDLILNYQVIMRRLQLNSQSDEMLKEMLEQEVKLRQVAFAGERNALIKMLNKKVITNSDYYSALRRIDHLEQRLSHEFNSPTNWWTIRRVRLLTRGMWHAIYWWLSNKDEDVKKRKMIDRETAKAAIKALSKYAEVAKDDGVEVSRQAIYHLIVGYRNRIERIKHPKSKSADTYQEQLGILRIKALSSQRNGIVQLLEGHRIGRSTAQKLQAYVNYSENVVMLTTEEE